MPLVFQNKHWITIIKKKNTLDVAGFPDEYDNLNSTWRGHLSFTSQWAVNNEQ